MTHGVMTDRMTVMHDPMVRAVMVVITGVTGGGGRGAECDAGQGDCDESLQARADDAHGASFVRVGVRCRLNARAAVRVHKRATSVACGVRSTRTVVRG